jgi:hypothetical protein
LRNAGATFAHLSVGRSDVQMIRCADITAIADWGLIRVIRLAVGRKHCYTWMSLEDVAPAVVATR